ncbi:spermidine synthase [Austwickia chelonae]|uniref:spermidine synthase n=1 Tax=Austwickia chelonae TaxID=100225 RepID=UPI001F0826B1|nr:fused MFS/spermidine synthase [Austwickia chelonae]
MTFETDPYGGVTVLRDGFPQSYVDVSDPTRLAFEYVAQMALAVDTLAPSGSLALTHVGGAGLTLPRYFAHTRPGSTQIVLEPDELSTQRVREELPLPRGHRIRVRGQDGLSGLTAMGSARADVVLVDAYAEGRVPAELVTVGFFAEVVRVLRPGGLLVANVADAPGRRFLSRVAAGCLATGLGQVALLGTHDVMKGRRFGNAVLVASGSRFEVDDLRRAATRCPFPTGVMGEEWAGQLRAARPFTTEDAESSPEPPVAGSWRR